MVYFALLPKTNKIKIGTTVNLGARLVALSYLYGQRVEYLGVMEGGRGVEGALHERFDRHRWYVRKGRGWRGLEVFDAGQEIWDFIDAHTEPGPDLPWWFKAKGECHDAGMEGDPS